MTLILFLGIGVLLAILWVDLRFDWLAVPYRGKSGLLSEDVLLPMTYYYRYVTGKPIVIALVMLSMLVTIILEIVQASVPSWIAWTSLVVFGTAITRSAILVIPTCRRFGRRTDNPEKETATAHALLAMHLFALSCVLVLAALQLYATMQVHLILFICIGFIAGFVWINLKFDWIAVPYRNKAGTLPEDVLAPITLFYRYLGSVVPLGFAMSVILISCILEIVQGSVPAWVAWTSLILFGGTMLRSIFVVIPSARRPAARVDSLERQTSMTHNMLSMHVFAFVIILIMAALQVYGVLVNS